MDNLSCIKNESGILEASMLKSSPFGFLIKGGAGALVMELASIADSSGSSVLDFMFNCVANTDQKVRRASNQVKQVMDAIEKLDKEVEQLYITMEQCFHQVIDILNKLMTGEQYKKIESITEQYKGAWLLYQNIIKDNKNISSNSSQEQKDELLKSMKELVFITLGLETKNGASKMKENITILANYISDCSSGLTLDGVSDLPNVTGKHLADVTTYIKSVYTETKSHALFEYQMAAAMNSEVSKVATGQVQLLTLYNEATNFLLAFDDPKIKEVGQYMSDNYSKVYNITVNSMNNMMEQSKLDFLMSEKQLNCTLKLHNEPEQKSPIQKAIDCYQVKLYQDDFKGDSFYIAKAPLYMDMFAYYSERSKDHVLPGIPYIIEHYYYASVYKNIFPYACVSTEKFSSDSSVIGWLGSFTYDESTTTQTNLTLFNDFKGGEATSFSKYCKINPGKDMIDYLNEVGKLSISKEYYGRKVEVPFIITTTPDDNNQRIDKYDYVDRQSSVSGEVISIEGNWLGTKSNSSGKYTKKECLWSYTSKDIINKSKVLYGLPIYCRKDTSITVKYEKNIYGGEGKGDIKGFGTQKNDYYIVTAGDRIEVTLSPKAYCMLKGFYFTPINNKSQKEALLGIVSPASNYSNPPQIPFTFTASYISGTYDAEFTWIDLSKIYSGSGTDTEPYILTSDSDFNTYFDLIRNGYPTKDYFFVYGLLSGKGTKESPYLIITDEDVVNIKKIIDNGFYKKDMYVEPAFLKPFGTSGDTFSIVEKEDADRIYEMTKMGISFQHYYFAPAFLKLFGTSGDTFSIVKNEDSDHIKELAKMDISFNRYYFAPAFLKGNGTPEDAFSILTQEDIDRLYYAQNNGVSFQKFCFKPTFLEGSGTEQEPFILKNIEDIKKVKGLEDHSYSFKQYRFSTTMLLGKGTESDPYLINTLDDMDNLNKIQSVDNYFYNYKMITTKLKGHGTRNDPYLIQTMEDYAFAVPLSDTCFFINNSCIFDMETYLGAGKGTELDPYIIRAVEQLEFIKLAIIGMKHDIYISVDCYFRAVYEGAPTGIGTTEDPYIISSPRDIKLLVPLCNSYVCSIDKIVSIVQDIDFLGEQIGNIPNFYATLEGNGHKLYNFSASENPFITKLFWVINNLKIEDLSSSIAPKGILVGTTDEESVISQVYFSSVFKEGSEEPVALVYENGGQISNVTCEIKGNSHNVMGICVNNKLEISNCSVKFEGDTISSSSGIAKDNDGILNDNKITFTGSKLTDINGICETNTTFISQNEVTISCDKGENIFGLYSTGINNLNTGILNTSMITVAEGHNIAGLTGQAVGLIYANTIKLSAQSGDAVAALAIYNEHGRICFNNGTMMEGNCTNVSSGCLGKSDKGIERANNITISSKMEKVYSTGLLKKLRDN